MGMVKGQGNIVDTVLSNSFASFSFHINETNNC